MKSEDRTPMLLIGRLVSPFTRRVAITLELLGLDYRVEPLSVANQEALRAFNPLGRVPALKLGDGSLLVDSSAIIDHLTEVAGEKQSVLPRSGLARRRVLQAAALASGAVEKFVAAYYERSRRPPEKVHEPWIEGCLAQARSALDHLEATARGPWLASETGPSLADITLATGLDFFARIDPSFIPPGRWPRLAAIAGKVKALPAFAATEPAA